MSELCPFETWIRDVDEALSSKVVADAVDGEARIIVSDVPALSYTRSVTVFVKVNAGVVRVVVDHGQRSAVMVTRSAGTGQVQRSSATVTRSDVTVKCQFSDLVAVLNGAITVDEAYMAGVMKVAGDRVLLIDGWRPLRQVLQSLKLPLP